MTHEDDNTKEHKQLRSTLASIVRVVGRNRQKISAKHLEAMKKTPFYLLFNAVYNRTFDSTDFRNLGCKTADIVYCFSEKRKKIVLGGQELSLTRNDVKYIFGIVDGKKPIKLFKGKRSSKWKFCNRVLGDVQELKQKIVKERLNYILNRENALPDDVDDVVRLICLYLISTLFFSITGVTITWGWVEYVEDLNEMRNYDWSGAILTTLLESIAEKKDNPYKILGCTTLLSYWLCEHTRIIKEKPAKETIPRFVKWNLSTLCSVVNREMLLGLMTDQVICGDLQPTNAELRMYKTLKMWPTPKEEKFGGDVCRNLESGVKLSVVDESAANKCKSVLEVENNVVNDAPSRVELPKSIGQQLSYADLLNMLETTNMKLHNAEDEIKEKETIVWSMNGRLKTKTIELSVLENNYQLRGKEVEKLKNQVAGLEKVLMEQKEQIRDQADEICKLEDRTYLIEVEPPVHSGTQAYSAKDNDVTSEGEMKQNSMVKRIKEKQRKAGFDDDFDYSDRKKSKKTNVIEHKKIIMEREEVKIKMEPENIEMHVSAVEITLLEYKKQSENAIRIIKTEVEDDEEINKLENHALEQDLVHHSKMTEMEKEIKTLKQKTNV